MRDPVLTPEEIQLTVEQPDFMSYQCSEHAFYLKEIEGKGKLLVYALRDGMKYDIKCADWLVVLDKIVLES